MIHPVLQAGVHRRRKIEFLRTWKRRLPTLRQIQGRSKVSLQAVLRSLVSTPRAPRRQASSSQDRRNRRRQNRRSRRRKDHRSRRQRKRRDHQRKGWRETTTSRGNDDDDSIDDAAPHPCYAVFLVQNGTQLRRSLLDQVSSNCESAPDSDRSGAQSRVAVHEVLRKVRVRRTDPALEQDVQRQAFLHHLQVSKPSWVAARRRTDLPEIVKTSTDSKFFHFISFHFVLVCICVIYFFRLSNVSRRARCAARRRVIEILSMFLLGPSGLKTKMLKSNQRQRRAQKGS